MSFFSFHKQSCQLLSFQKKKWRELWVNVCAKEIMCVLKESNTWVQEVGIGNCVENIDETNLPLPLVKSFGLTSGASVRGTVGLILVRKVFNCFNFL